jgi:osmotically-inducible protein OsmY
VDGVVILTGNVAEEYHKALAQETVASLPGVNGIVNKLETKGAPPTGNSDGWLNEKVRAILVLHKSVDSGATIIYVKDGIVNLSGDAVSETQKELTTEYAKDVEGVKGVNNLMIVTKTPAKTTRAEDIDDASVTAHVKLSLLYHRSTSAINTKVETNNGNVTLYGKAGSAAEWNLATRLAEDVKGVKNVDNRMTMITSRYYSHRDRVYYPPLPVTTVFFSHIYSLRRFLLYRQSSIQADLTWAVAINTVCYE